MLEGGPQEGEGKVFHQCLLYRFLMGAESETRPEQVMCYRAGAETGAGFGREEGEVKVCS